MANSARSGIKSNKGNIVIFIAIILIICCLISVVLVIIYAAINPAKNFADARNAQRQADVHMIVNAIDQYQLAESKSITVPNCQSTKSHIGTGTGKVDLSTMLVDEYITSIPKDPTIGTDQDTGYTICKKLVNGDPRLEVGASGAENAKEINITSRISQ